MSRLKRSSHPVCFLALIGGLTGCGPTRPAQLWNPFLPPEPEPVRTAFVSPDPPKLQPAEPRVHLRLDPRLIPGQGEPQSRATALLREADWHFQAGKKSYQEGDENAARREFDRAVDILLSAPEGLTATERSSVEHRLDQLVEAIHRYDLAGLGAADVTAEPGFEKAPLEDIPAMTFPIEPGLKNKVLEEIRATASQLPLQATDAVLGYIHYFSSARGRKILLSGLRRAGRYRPLIQRILDEEGVPQELIHLAQAESGFLPRAVSRKKAAGMWQFMRTRGNQYGLVQTSYSDDRLDPEKATRAAARHLRDLYDQFGDWYLAMAAYNSGPGVIEQAVERTGYADFWELRRRKVLPKETSNYVPIIVAVTIMVKNAREHALDGVETDSPLGYDTLETTAPTNLLLVTDLTDCPLSQLRELNPALLKNLAPAGYMLRVPKGSGNAVASALEAVPPEHRRSWRVHRVGEEDTVKTIARRYRMSEQSILAVNQLSGRLEVGDLVLIPVAGEKRSATGRSSRSKLASRKAPSRASTASRGPRRASSARAPALSYSAANLRQGAGRSASLRR